jgi:hypothetical protein
MKTNLFINQNGGIVEITYSSRRLTLTVRERGYFDAWSELLRYLSEMIPEPDLLWVDQCRASDRPGRRLRWAKKE